MGRSIFRFVQLNTGWIDFAPTFQKQRRLNDEAKIQQGRKAWSTRRTPGILSVLSLLQSLKSCCTHVQREEINRAALGKKSCACAFCLCHAAQSRQPRYSCCGESTERWEAVMEEVVWGLLPQRHHFLRRERGSVSLYVHSHGHLPSGWPLQGSMGN